MQLARKYQESEGGGPDKDRPLGSLGAVILQILHQIQVKRSAGFDKAGIAGCQGFGLFFHGDIEPGYKRIIERLPLQLGPNGFGERTMFKHYAARNFIQPQYTL